MRAVFSEIVAYALSEIISQRLTFFFEKLRGFV
jgi:hypothetical protein